MKKFNKVAILFAVATVAGSAFAAGSTSNSDNWRNGHGDLNWKNGTNELCWRDSNWTPATAAPGCDGALVAPKAEPAPPPVVTPPVATPPAPPAPPPPPIAAEKVTFAADAFFDFNKSVLKPEGRAVLDDLVAGVKDLNLEVIVAVGHTDSVGSAAYNQRLSVRRAEAVKAYLVSKGIEAGKVFTEGKGESAPVASNKTSAGRAQNRRVDIEVVAVRPAK